MNRLTLLVGHRGVGKSQLLERIGSYYASARRKAALYDLDREIERAEKTPIESIFTRRGEAAFRELERFHLARLMQEASEVDVYISLGAGFPGPIPPNASVLWVRRESDPHGRVFTDRPRLDTKVSALREYGDRFRQRHPRYAGWAHETLFVPEGFDKPNATERAYFLDELEDIGGTLTLLPENFQAPRDFKAFAKKRLKWGVRFFELRDDLLLPPAMALAREVIPDKKLIFSFRRQVHPHAPFDLKGLTWDWPLEFGDCPHAAPPLISLHERLAGESVAEAGQRLNSRATAKTLLKLAVQVANFRELEEGHAWMKADPERRAFLPSSPDGRWGWYRLQCRSQSGIGFFREGDGSSADQPLLLDWARHKRPAPYFAAILGDPVAFSRTPGEQEAFFTKKGVGVLPVRLSEEDWRNGGIQALERLGLRYAAVTSPLKHVAYETASERTQTAEQLQSVNTLQWKDGKWRGDNTDIVGLREWLAPLVDKKDVAVWGGGGTLAALREVLPHATYYAARTGQPRDGAKPVAPAHLIWASSVEGVNPPAEWRVKKVYDLSYRENSPGRVYAQSVRAEYDGGLTMFVAQGRAQREFWD